MPDTLRLTLDVPSDVRDLLVADLSDLGFDAFEETDAGLVAYAPAARWDATTQEAVARHLDAAGGVGWEEDVLEDRDWNATWEASLRPTVAGPFVIAPSWTDVGPEHEGRTTLRIDPKMAFGTGYHESTRLVLRLLPDVVLPNARVLDVGTGTGVLSIAALALGAASAVGVDVDPWSVVNGTENAALNGVGDRFDVREGSLDVVPEVGFDLIVANIIRSVLAPMLPDLAAKASPGAPVVLAGLLVAERDPFLDAAGGAGLSLEHERSENEWWACSLRRDEGGGAASKSSGRLPPRPVA